MIPSSLQSLLEAQPGKLQPWFSDIEISEEFQFSKALTTWQNWNNLVISKSQLEWMLAMKYEEFRDNTNPDISRVRHALFSLVAYCDTKANNKQLLNEYPDKRTIARAGIYQNVWVKQLLLFKLGVPLTSKGTQNMIAYLESPRDNWPIVSENHRQQILLWLTGKQYNRATFNQDMEDALGKYWHGKNPDNKTTYFTRCIYHLDNEWKNPPIEGLFAHDTDDTWKSELIHEMQSSAYGCIWWHKRPVNYKNEIISSLRSKINDGETFDFFYISGNMATHRARVVDFSLKESYNKVVSKWKEKAPVWFNEEAADYMSSTQSADIIFLIDKFEKLGKPIPINKFRRYKNMKYSQRQTMAAYSEIKGGFEPTPADPYVEKLVRLLEKNRNLILTGAPGTGKTYLAAQMAKAMNAQYERVQFHPSYDYTDFVEGLRPEKNEGKEIGFKLMPGSFKLFCQKALDSLDNNPEESPKYLFHIDEINRGEISKIFGELFFSIEPSYRGEKGKVKTQYHNLITDGDIFEDGFFVPENVYIIGTMNDIDRGVEAMDFAIRRRFAWIEVKASDRLQMLDSMTESGVSQSVIDEAKLRMTSLNNAISEVESLGDAYHVGGAYFLNLTNYIDDPDPFGKLWEYHLRGLLYEYLRGLEDWKETLNKFKDEYDHPKADHTDH